MDDCIFCKIAKGEIPSDCLYSDGKIFAFYDINPQAPVHFLVIPQEHIASVREVTSENSGLVADCFEVIAKLAENLGLDDGFRVISNIGADAGQTVFHLHFHVLSGKKLGEKLINN